MSKWFIRTKKADFFRIGEKYNISPVLARIIRNRDIIEDADISKYLFGTLKDFYDPFLLKDMDKAVDIILKERKAGKKFRVIGDYDIDGICATYILLKGLENIGIDADYDIPSRIEDGYGLNENLVLRAHEAGVQVIITCDNGIAAVSQIKKAKELGMTVIVTDHHNPQEILPDADAIIDQKQADCNYPYKEICGAFVAYKLIQGLYERINELKDQNIATANKCEKDEQFDESADEALKKEKILDDLLQFAGFATVGDVVELCDENRIVVKEALKRINNTQNLGLKALINANDLADKEIKAYHIGFILGPCINASGRLDSAKIALEMLLSTEYVKAYKYAMELKVLNEMRKEITENATNEAIDLVEKYFMDDNVLVVYMSNCHESIVGIVAGRLRERFYKPSIVLTNGADSIKGSGRSIDEYDMFSELVKVSDMFEKFGGHKKAAGLTLKENVSVDDFRKALNDNEKLTKDNLLEKIWIDSELPFDFINVEFIESLGYLEPFGMGNEKPKFALRDISINSIKLLGANKNVLRYNLEDSNKKKMSGITFRNAEVILETLRHKFGIEAVERLVDGTAKVEGVNILFYPDINEFRGEKNIQLVVEEVS